MSALEFDLLIRMGLTHEEIACASEPGPWGIDHTSLWGCEPHQNRSASAGLCQTKGEPL